MSIGKHNHHQSTEQNTKQSTEESLVVKVLVLLCYNIQLMIEFYFNFYYNYKREAQIDLRVKDFKILIWPSFTFILCCYYRWYLEKIPHYLIYLTPWNIFIPMLVFSTFLSLIVSRSINLNIRFTRHMLNELTNEKSKIEITENVMTVLKSKQSEMQMMQKLSLYYKNIKQIKDCLLLKFNTNLVIIILIAILLYIYFVAMSWAQYLPNPSMLFCMMSLMQIQIMSSWQLSDYNSVIMDIETFHNLDTELLIKFGKWIPNKDWVLSVTISISYNFFVYCYKLSQLHGKHGLK